MKLIEDVREKYRKITNNDLEEDKNKIKRIIYEAVKRRKKSVTVEYNCIDRTEEIINFYIEEGFTIEIINLSSGKFFQISGWEI